VRVGLSCHALLSEQQACPAALSQACGDNREALALFLPAAGPICVQQWFILTSCQAELSLFPDHTDRLPTIETTIWARAVSKKRGPVPIFFACHFKNDTVRDRTPIL
jgi:hypothetical protein